jgi:hypothetical protein
MTEVQALTKTLGLDAETLAIRHAEDIAPAFSKLKKECRRFMFALTRS